MKTKIHSYILFNKLNALDLSYKQTLPMKKSMKTHVNAHLGIQNSSLHSKLLHSRVATYVSKTVFGFYVQNLSPAR